MKHLPYIVYFNKLSRASIGDAFTWAKEQGLVEGTHYKALISEVAYRALLQGGTIDATVPIYVVFGPAGIYY